MVPARAPREARLGASQLLRVVRRRPGLRRDADHLLRHREVELDVGPGRRRVLLAPLLLAPARPELRQPAGAEGGAERHALVARPRHRRRPARRGAVSRRARRHDEREPSRDARHPEADPAGGRPRLSGPAAARRGQHVARGHAAVLRRRRRMPHGVPFPADAADVHGDRAGGPLPDHRHPAADAGHPAELPVGDLPAQSRRADARDGDGPRARLPLELLRGRPARADQPRHPPPPRAAARTRSSTHRADELAAAVDAGYAGDLLRRRDRHGRQHPPRRSRRRPHADAVVARPQRRLLARESVVAGAAGDHGSAVRLRRGQRRDAGHGSALDAELDAPHARDPLAAPGVRSRRAAHPVAGQSQGARLSARASRRRRQRRDDPVRRERVALRAAGRTRAVGVQRARAGRDDRRLDVSRDRRAAVRADAAAVRLLLVHARRPRRSCRSGTSPRPRRCPTTARSSSARTSTS